MFSNMQSSQEPVKNSFVHSDSCHVFPSYIVPFVLHQSSEICRLLKWFYLLQLRFQLMWYPLIGMIPGAELGHDLCGNFYRIFNIYAFLTSLTNFSVQNLLYQF